MVRGNLFHKTVYCTEFVQCVLTCTSIALFSQRPLSGVDDKPGHIHATGVHLGQVHLCVQIRQIVGLFGKIGGIDVHVGVHHNHPFVDGPCPRNQLRLGFSDCFRHLCWCCCRHRLRRCRRLGLATGCQCQHRSKGQNTQYIYFCF